VIEVAEAYEIAAKWHDKCAVGCREISLDDPRIAVQMRNQAADAAKHHLASAAGLRLAAINIRRRDMESPKT